MNKSIYKIDDIKKQVVINGIQVEVNVSFNIQPDGFMDGDIDFETEQDKLDFYKKLNNGHIENVMIFVTASYKGIDGNDTLGGNLIENWSDIHDAIDAHSMIDNAVEELVKNIVSLSKDLKQFS